MQAGPGLRMLGTGKATDPFIVSLSSPLSESSVFEGGANLSDVDAGTNVVRLPLTENVTTLTLPETDVDRFDLLVEQVAGGSTIAWPAQVKWPGGTAPTLSTGAGDIDWLTFRRVGASWLGVPTALTFS